MMGKFFNDFSIYFKSKMEFDINLFMWTRNEHYLYFRKC